MLLFTLAAFAQDLEPSSVAWSPDGRRIAVGAPGGVIVVDAGTLLEERRLAMDAGAIMADFLPDGRLVASGNHTNAGRMWDAATGAELAVADAPFACADPWGGSWHCEAWDRGWRATWVGGTMEPWVRVEAWDGAAFTERRRIAERTAMHRPVVAAGPGDRVAVAGDGGASLLRTEWVMSHLRTEDPELSALGRVEVPLRTRGGYVRVWARDRLQCEQMDLPARVTAVAVRGDAVLAGLSDGSVAWLSDACEPVATTSLGTAAITGVAWAPSGDRAVMVDASGGLAVITPEWIEARVTLR